MSRKEEALGILDRLLPGINRLGSQLFDRPELGFKEFETAALIQTYLADHGLDYQGQIALTGVRAKVGSGGYHIALVADMDALEVQGPDGRPLLIHSCGHSIQLAVMLAVLHSLYLLDKAQALTGQVSFVATPAEEFVDLDYRQELIAQGKIRYASGKQNMIAQGLFDGVDSALSCHVMGGPDGYFDLGSTLAGFTVKKAVFHGLSAHSGAAPHEGKNALHAANLCLTACAFLKDTFPPQAGIRLQPILTEGGLSMNAIPERAVLETYLRANSRENLILLQERFDEAAYHSAQALGMTASIENTVGYLPLRQSEALNAVVYDNMRSLCPARDILLKPQSAASGDIGDLASLLPAVQLGFSGIRGRIHSHDFSIPDPERIYRETARVVMGTVMDLLENPDIQVRNPHYEEDKTAYMKDWLGQA